MCGGWPPSGLLHFRPVRTATVICHKGNRNYRNQPKTKVRSSQQCIREPKLRRFTQRRVIHYLCLLAFLGCFWRLVFPCFCAVGSGPLRFVPVAVGGDLTSLASVHMPILTYQVENTRHTYCCLPPVCCLLWPCAPPPCLVSPQLRKVVNEIRPSHCRFPPLHSSAYAFK